MSYFRKTSVSDEPDITDAIIPFLRVLQEDKNLREWFFSMEFYSPDRRAEEFEKLAVHSDNAARHENYGDMIRNFKVHRIYIASLRSLRKLDLS